MTPAQRIDAAVESASRRLASGFSRRSFLGQVGGGAVALSVGGLATAADQAYAECGPCTGVDSVTCKFLTGENHCPGNSCTGGFWVVSGGICQTEGRGTETRWADCLGECGTCTCHNENGTCRPSCCNFKQWPGGCHEGEQIRIKCRVWSCP